MSSDELLWWAGFLHTLFPFYSLLIGLLWLVIGWCLLRQIQRPLLKSSLRLLGLLLLAAVLAASLVVNNNVVDRMFATYGYPLPSYQKQSPQLTPNKKGRARHPQPYQDGSFAAELLCAIHFPLALLAAACGPAARRRRLPLTAERRGDERSRGHARVSDRTTDEQTMTVSRSELEQRFRMLADEVLLQRYQSGELTDLAQSVALQELRSRGISPPIKGLVIEQAPPAISAQGADRVTVPVELSWAQAHALTARLNSQAIAATLVDAQLPVAGQVRVMVYERDLPAAMALAAALHRGDFALDDEFDGDAEQALR